MLKSFWPLWLLAGALTLCLVCIAWLQWEVRTTATALVTLQSAHEANVKTLQGLQEAQAKQDTVLLGWNERQQNLNNAASTKAKAVREAAKNADFKTWADRPLPVDAFRVLQSTGLAH